MEDVLEVYSREYDEKKPVICMEEKPVQFLAESRKNSISPRIRYEIYSQRDCKHIPFHEASGRMALCRST